MTISAQPLIETIRDMFAAFSPWNAQTVKQEQALAAAETALQKHDQGLSSAPAVSPECREIVGDVFGTAALISAEPFSLEEVDILLKAQRARMTNPPINLDDDEESLPTTSLSLQRLMDVVHRPAGNTSSEQPEVPPAAAGCEARSGEQ